jgi:anti-anti-sigma factor
MTDKSMQDNSMTDTASSRQGLIAVAKDKGLYAIRLTGDVRLVLCLGFNEYIQQMFQDPELHVIIFDLQLTKTLDSTTLGLMAKVALECRKRNQTKPLLLTQSSDILRLVDSMGFDEIFTISTQIPDLPNHLEDLNCKTGSENCFRERVLDAHKVLMSLNEQNRLTFKELVETLERNP